MKLIAFVPFDVDDDVEEENDLYIAKKHSLESEHRSRRYKGNYCY